ncbi:MAG TPA: 2-dehydropantoate 2-reductase [Casimicrobiaceae bacterium]|nr:2-dehydropantoate 2-reductase [Casimicrobiaceae bacterium]
MSMKICIYGAGAVGGAMAARLADDGNRVSVIARGAHGQAMRERGVTLVTQDERIQARVECVESASDLPKQDVVIVTVKGPSLSAIAEGLAQLTTPESRVVFCMNGIPWWFSHGLGYTLSEAAADSLDPGRRLQTALPLDRTIGGVIYSSNEVMAPGVVHNTSPRNRFIVGTPDGREDAVTAALVDRLKAAGYDAYQTGSIREALWTKMLIVVGGPPVAALTDCALDRLVNDDETRALMASLMREGLTIGRRLGFDVVDDIDERLAYYVDKPVRPSMLQDFQLKRPPELESTILAFGAIADALRIEAPMLKLVGTLVRMRREGVYAGERVAA